MSHYFPLYENIFSLNLFVSTIQFIINMSEKQRNKYILRSIIYIYIFKNFNYYKLQNYD